jgi:hypothetical protein
MQTKTKSENYSVLTVKSKKLKLSWIASLADRVDLPLFGWNLLIPLAKRKKLSTANHFKEKLSSSTGRAQNSATDPQASAAKDQQVNSVHAVKVGDGVETAQQVVVIEAESAANTAAAKTVEIEAADFTTVNSSIVAF